MAKNRGGTESLTRKIKAVYKVKDFLPDMLANQCVMFFRRSFSNQGYTDSALKPWKPRKSKKESHPILVKSGNLLNSIRKVNVSYSRITIESDLPYSAIHNNGGQGLAFGKHPFTMPKRQFMGDSKSLRNGLQRRIEVEYNKAFKA